MNNPGWRRARCRLVAAMIAPLLATSVVGAQTASAPAASGPSQGVSWNGDPSVPDLSGVWRLAEAAAAGRTSKEGWMPWPPPLKGEFAAKWRKEQADAAAGTRADDPVVSCQPPGMPRFITGDRGPLLIIQSHERVTLYRDGMGPRRAWLDGRKLPGMQDAEPFYSGTTIGHYEGKDLVLETIGFKDQPIDSTGVPHSSQLRIDERYHRVDATTLRITVTLTDPLAYQQAVSSTVTYKRVDDPLWEPREFICTPKTDYHPDLYVH